VSAGPAQFDNAWMPESLLSAAGSVRAVQSETTM
jgi:hypothetical protein